MIHVTRLNKTYNRRRGTDNRVLKEVSFTLPDTGFVCILGPSGCGKTSLLNAIGGLDRFDSGILSTGDTTVSRYGTAAYESQRNRNFGYIFQNYYLLDEHSVAYNIYLGLHSLNLSHKQKLERVRMALQAVDMERYIRRKVKDLSGGQQQRVAIARALARRPRVIFADEPTGNLDEANTRNICTLLRQASKESLVLMVTHEESIANFFADRIIRLDQGHLVSDSEVWERKSLLLSSDKEVYTGDYLYERANSQNVSVQLLRTENAPQIAITVIAAQDRIILKLADSRTVTLSTQDQPPKIIQGKRPEMTLEHLDRGTGAQSQLFQLPPAPPCRAGKGVRFSMMVREAFRLMGGKGFKKVGVRIFLILLTVLTLLTVADFITISKVDPRDFVTTDSHLLDIEIESGNAQLSTQHPDGAYTWRDYYTKQYLSHISRSGLDFDLIPIANSQPKFTVSLFFQMYNAEQRLPGCGFADIRRLDESTLLCGRMAENSEEVVLDKQVLDALLKQDGIVQNSITDYSSFLGEILQYGNKGLNPAIVGICDSGERTLYTTMSALYALGSGGTPVVTVSELRARYGSAYDVLEMPDGTFRLDDLTQEDCVVNAAAAGAVWKYRLGSNYGTGQSKKTVQAYIENDELAAYFVVSDETLDQLIRATAGAEFSIWCEDKQAMMEYLSEPTEFEERGNIRVSLQDRYGQMMAQYQQAAQIRADGRIIVTVTIMMLSMVMLYLLCRSKVTGHLGLIAVYRLLGIPGRKLSGIFLMEAIISSALTVVPTAALIWAGLLAIQKVPELNFSLELPWQAAMIACLGIFVYFLIVTLIPLSKLLRLPPAQLAAKYDI